MPDATRYTYRVTWSAEDGEHVATVAEFPSLSWLAATPGQALASLAGVVRDVLADLATSGEQIPEPSPAYGIRWPRALMTVVIGNSALASQPSARATGVPIRRV